MKRYRVFWSRLNSAYSEYGGFREWIFSPFLHIAAVLTVASFPMTVSGSWSDIALASSPSLLGFILAGYTIFISSLSDEIRAALSNTKDGQLSVFRRINVTFFHFIFFQAFIILYAVLFENISKYSIPLFMSHIGIINIELASILNNAGFLIISFIGSLSLFYGVALVIAVLIWIYRIMNIVEQYEIIKKNAKNQPKDR